MSHRSHSLRLSAYYHDEAPAFHAGIIVLVILAALLGNFGLFLVLISAHAALDTVKYREVRKLSWGKTLQSVLRESLFDVMLLMLAINVWFYLQPDAGILASGGWERSLGTTVRGMGTLLLKIAILLRVLPALVHPQAYLRHKTFNPRSRLTAMELLCFAVCLGSCLALAYTPILLQGGLPTAIRLLATQLPPWRF